ncbi:hypothetical protein ACLB2K_062023 [Fragaria x ananassa]
MVSSGAIYQQYVQVSHCWLPEIGKQSVAIPAQKRVTELNLSSLKLSGSISPHIGNLSFLRVLRLYNNSLTNKIPPEIGHSQRLQIFSLGNNSLSGTIPANISNCFNLRFLSVSNNMLVGNIPPQLDSLSKLEYLVLQINNLTGEIPPSLGNLSSLDTLGARQNNLVGSNPSSLGQLKKLSSFTVESNRGFNILNNHLGSGSDGDISFLSDLTNATKLEFFNIAFNNFGGTLPASISVLSTLSLLNVNGNQLQGSIPAGIANLVNMKELYLGDNMFTGNIPTDIGKLLGLGSLILQNNRLSGSLPSSLGNLTTLIELNLLGNHFNGTIPTSLGECRSLLLLDLSSNNLSGDIPPKSYWYFLLINIFGFVRESSQWFPSLGGRKVKKSSLEVLLLQGNFFDGPIPSALSSMKGIQELDLSHNNLSGEIPEFLAGFGGLKQLNLSFNDFSGAVPVKGVFNNASVISVVGNTRLCGGISDLRLPKCKSKESRSPSKKLTISLVSTFTVLGVAMLVAFLFICFFKKKSKETPSSTLANFVLEVSFSALLKATDGFSATNLIGAGSFGSVYRGILGEDGDQLVAVKAFVYKHIENGSLEEWLHPTTETEDIPKSLSLVQRLDITIDVACAVDYLHNHCETPIVHCDLKPSNVLLENDLTGHVGDFGLARILSRLADNVLANQSSSVGIRGTVGYAAPEYGMGSEVSTCGDVYSFGILLLEMFTGKRPTDHIFVDSLNLHNCVKMAFGNRVSGIADSSLVQEGNPSQSTNDAFEERSSSILEIGVACSVESPPDRKNISHVVSELKKIRATLVG